MGREDIRLSHMAKKGWLKDEDQNSKFFHTYLNAKNRKRVNEMGLVDGTILKSSFDIHHADVEYFQDFLGVSGNNDLPILSDLISPMVTAEENLEICRTHSLEEIKKALFSILVDSSPGPDSFGFGFYRVDKPFGFDKFRPVSLCSVSCITTLWYSIMMNDISIGFLNGERGLRQGDPLSRLLNKSFKDGIIGQFVQARGTPLISHLMYADDTVIFANGGKRSIRGLMKVLNLYEHWIGPVLSREKSAIFFSKRISLSRKSSILRITSFSEISFPFKYLGVPIVVSRLKVRDFSELLGKIKKKITGWKMKMLSNGGHTILICHVLLSMATHLLAVLHVPKTVIKVLNKLPSSFFWSGSEGNFKRKWIAWSTICRPVEEGGLGIRDFGGIQKALHLKLVWRLITGKSLWMDFFKGKYVRGNHLSLLELKTGTQFWKSLVKSIHDVLSNSKWKVREGNISFWYDKWDDDGPLCDHYPVIEQLMLKIKECRLDNGWDIPLLERLVVTQKVSELCQSLARRKDGHDILIWLKDTDAQYEDKVDNVVSIWHVIKFWLRKIMQLSMKVSKISSQDVAILNRLDISILVPKPKKVRVVRWSRPQHGWVKLNTDGSSLGNPGQAGAWGVISANCGKLCQAYFVTLGHGSNNFAELRSVLEGVRRCYNLGFYRVEIETYSQLIVNWITKGKCNIWYLDDFWEDLIGYLNCMEYRVCHIFREGNTVTDFLAKWGARGLNMDLVNGDSLPGQLRDLLRLDKMGSSSPGLQV
ncbi:uncharacterized protein LOC121252418 [Juglans microcarpa x Juglans regia]|uniref:uncharacterized protein LOC121252418 n=1 Tax=Juglans microcarpa x Juglans regia TaxID=2249226 RepID=UPI001B7E32BF|nr:uncharacterized protein LOC121252418 [Juglans microcarpa x Juglans regia]